MENIEKKSSESAPNPDSGVPEAPKTFSLEVLRMIKDAQQQHGLRHGDYQRYRGYCTRRVRRLRKVLKLPQYDKRHYKKKDVSVGHLQGSRSDVRYLHIPLMMAERAWAYGMQLRQEANTEPRKKFHLVGKLRKACLYALQLQELSASDCCDARTRWEIEAYNAWMHGTLHFELSLWKSAIENLKRAQLVYQNLGDALPEEEQSLYRAKVDELTPSIRYCAYNIGEGASMDDLLELRAQGLLENLESLATQVKSQSTEALQTTEWRGRKMGVRPEKARLFLMSIQDLDKSIEKAKSIQAKIEILETVIMDCKDAITAIKEEIKQDPKLRATSQGGQIVGIHFLLSYLTYIRLMRTLERNMLLVKQAKASLEDASEGGGKKVRPQDMTRLYEIILQNVTELQQVPGLEEDEKYQEEILSLSTTFRAFRCYYIALTLVAMKRWKEAVALYERSMNYAKEALTSSPKAYNLAEELKHLISTIEGCKFSAHAYSVLEDDASDEAGAVFGRTQKSSKPLYERLSEYKEDATLHSKNPNVFKITPDMEPIPCKPLFFDLALNFIEFPSLEDKVESPGGKKQPAGISGFVKGFLGWGGASK
ncbi:signal recognition particle subunit SRP68-like [Phlebotomus papatasi]|uniref:signal recognition particle subunit SRP68-like n=1 Tax=Phlebotomus papatasi TaxID=29031 RepID=UPI002483A9D5|nr:signal recognition particle subunit SRP68-like [Phlebotomus papatasi]